MLTTRTHFPHFYYIFVLFNLAFIFIAVFIAKYGDFLVVSMYYIKYSSTYYVQYLQHISISVQAQYRTWKVNTYKTIWEKYLHVWFLACILRTIIVWVGDTLGRVCVISAILIHLSTAWCLHERTIYSLTVRAPNKMQMTFFVENLLLTLP